METLSRGKGVPEDARQAFSEIIARLEASRDSGTDVSFSKDRFGLEGETRLQVRFADPKTGEDAYAEFQKLVKGIDLISIRQDGRDAGSPSD